jgi:hypothetical protein
MTIAEASATSDLPPTLSELLSGNYGDAIVMAASKDPNSKVIVLLIPRGSRTPTLAVKVPTTSVASTVVEAEGRVLQAVHTRTPPRIRESIPFPIGFVAVGRFRALVATALPGTPMARGYHRWRHITRARDVRADFNAASQWLEQLHAATAHTRASLDMDGGVVAGLRSRFGEPDTASVIATVSEIHSHLRTASTPRTVVHGDYWFGNLLVSGDSVVGVVDWENATISGQPMRDVVRFVLGYALYLDRHTRPQRPVRGHQGLRAGRWGAGILYAIEGRGWFPTLVRQFIGDHLERLGAPRGLWRDAALAGVAEVAATADDPEFALRHLQLLRTLMGLGQAEGRR